MSLTTLQEEVPQQEGQQDNPSQTEEELNTPEDILVSPYQPAVKLIEPQTAQPHSPIPGELDQRIPLATLQFCN